MGKGWPAWILFFALQPGWNLLHAQPKPVGLEPGFRYGAAPALSYRVFYEEKRAFELLFTKSSKSLLFTVMHQHLRPAGPSGLYLHYGYGGSIGGRNDRQITTLDMQLGAVYYFSFVPLNLDFGFRPYAVLTGTPQVDAELAVTLRWVF